MPAKSKSQQAFMGMVHATKKGELKNPSKAVKKAAEGMSDKAAKDFASTKTKDLSQHVKESFGQKAKDAFGQKIDKLLKNIKEESSFELPEVFDLAEKQDWIKSLPSKVGNKFLDEKSLAGLWKRDTRADITVLTGGGIEPGEIVFAINSSASELQLPWRLKLSNNNGMVKLVRVS